MPMYTESENSQIKRSQDGVWTLVGHELHIDIPQLLKVANLEDTDENRNIALAVAMQLARQQYPGVKLVIRE